MKAKTWMLALTCVSFSQGMEAAHASSPLTVTWKGDFATKSFTPTESCGLTRFTLANVFYSRSENSDVRYESRIGSMAAYLETSDPSCLKEYAVVQWIRGCMYSQHVNRNTGEDSTYPGLVRENRGRDTRFVHPDWEVDSVDQDPLYNNADVMDQLDPHRLDYYRIPKVPVDFSRPKKEVLSRFEYLINRKESHTYVQDTETPTNVYYTKDMPTGARWSVNRYDSRIEGGTASSLEFQTCVYRVKDVPVQGDPAHFSAPSEVGGPVACFPWQMKQRWNFTTRVFETFEGIDPKCSEFRP